jgi:hypothetical protein
MPVRRSPFFLSLPRLHRAFHALARIYTRLQCGSGADFLLHWRSKFLAEIAPRQALLSRQCVIAANAPLTYKRTDMADVRIHIQKAHPRAVRTRQQQQQALELRKGGASYLEIGAALGVTKQRAYTVVISAMDELGTITREGAAQVKQMELERLNSMHMSLWPQRKNPRVVDTLLRIQERRARLLGLDAPTKTALTDADGGSVQFVLKSILDQP